MAETDLTPEGRDDMIRPKGFDDYEVRLGDLLRGERATLRDIFYTDKKE